jgi:CMP-N-acetylneuraminic acid synthetase
LGLKVFGFIFARGGSKGIFRKNLVQFSGKPLILHTIDFALNTGLVDKVFVSTDDHEIAEVARAGGACVIDRPKYLATDDSPEILSWKHAVETLQNSGISFDIFLCLPCTAPLRRHLDIKRCIESLTPDFDIVFTYTKSKNNPWFNMITCEKNSVSLLLKTGRDIVRRQDAPLVYNLTTVGYASWPKFILSANSLWDGRSTGVEIPIANAIDIDDDFDLKLARAIDGGLLDE